VRTMESSTPAGRHRFLLKARMLHRRTKIIGTRTRPARGTSTLELVLVFPILLMLSLGVVDYGYYIYLKNLFQGAAQAGARAALPAAATNSSVNGTTGVVTQMMTAAGFPSANYTVTLSPSNVSNLPSGTAITVTVSASWSTVGTHALSSSWGGIGGAKQIVASAVVQKE
jgi:Flp pilus assembly protein TadG